MSTSLAFRLRVRDQSTLAAPNGTIDALIASSVAGVGYPYLADEPMGDGAQIDPLQGTFTTGAYRVKVIDAAAAGMGVIPGAFVSPAGIVTSMLNAATDAPLVNSLLSRRAYLEVSNDGGVTWPTVWIAGYVMRVQLLDAATYEFTIGDTLRVEKSATVFKTLVPGLDQGTCILGGPIAGTPLPTPVMTGGRFGHHGPDDTFTAPDALPWNAATNYVPGNLVVVPATGIVYICTANNLNDLPPDVAHWTALPPGFAPSGIWNAATTYTTGSGAVVVYQGNAYLFIGATNSTNNPPPNVTYWEPLTAVMLPNWGIIQDYGGDTFVVGQIGTSTPSFSMTLISGWFKVPVKKPGDPAWEYRAAGSGGTATPIPSDFSSANALVPQLCAQYGPSPRGYGGSFLNPNGGGFIPGAASASAQGGVIDTNTMLGTLGDLGWIIGGVILQVTLPTGQVVSVNAYPQLYNQGSAKGARYTQTPVLIHPRSRTVWVDWHDAYRVNATTLQPIDPVDQNGISVPFSAITGSLALKVKAVVLPISQNTPLHLAMHPLDLLCTLWANAGIQWNPANVGVTLPVGVWNNTTVYTQYQVVAVTTTSGGDITSSAYYMANQATVPANTAVTNTSYWTQVTTPLVATGGGMRATLGRDLALVLQVTAPMSIKDVREQWICGPLGVGARVNSAGAFELFLTRTVPNTVPSVTWTDSDCIDADESVIWDLDEQRACLQAVYNWNSFVDWDSNINQTRPLDDVVPIPNSSALVDNDFAVYGTQSVSYTIPGGFAGLNMQSGPSMLQFANALAQQIFERYGRASVWATVSILGTSAQAQLGDIVIFNSIRTPNPALNERSGPRLMQVIKKTYYPYGAQYVLEDLGASGAVAATAPTISLALDTADPYHVVDVTVTNIAALLSAYPNGSIQIQYTVLLPQDGGSPPSGVYGIIASDQFIASTTAATCTLPPVAMGSVVAVRAQSRPGAGQLASAWSAWSTITVNGLTAITGLAWMDAGNGSGTLTWTNVAATTPVQVWMTDGLHKKQLIPITQLPPGSNYFTLVGLSASTTYTAAIAHLEPAPSSGFSTPMQVTFTTGSSSGTCAAPSNPIPWVLTHPHQSSSWFAIYNNEPVPGTAISVDLAVETGIGTDLFTDLGEYARSAVSPFSWYVLNLSLPHDGLRRQLKAKAIRNGVTDSSYSPTVLLLPGQALAPADYPVAVPACTFTIVNSGTGQTGQVAIAVTYTPPTDVQFLQMQYGVQVRPIGSSGAYTTLQTVPGTASGVDYIPATPGNQYLITPMTVTTGSPALLTADGITVNPVVNQGAATPVTMALGVATPTFTTPTADSNNVSYSWTYDVYTAYIEVFSALFASNPGLSSVESPANYVAPTLDRTKTALLLSVNATDPWRVTTFVSYDAYGNRGSSQTFTTQRTGAATTSAPTLTQASNLPLWTQIKATFVTTPSVGDYVILYRGGVQYTQQFISSTDITNGYCTIIDFSTVTSTAYSYTVTQTTAGSTSALSSALVITTASAGGTLGTPLACTFTKSSRTTGHFTTGYLTIIPHSGGGNTPPPPSGIVFQLFYSTTSSSGPWSSGSANEPDGTGLQINMGIVNPGVSPQVWFYAVAYDPHGLYSSSANGPVATATEPGGSPW